MAPPRLILEAAFGVPPFVDPTVGKDPFTRADAAIGTAEIGGAWTAHTGTWSVVGNEASGSGVLKSVATIAAPAANVNVSTDYRAVSDAGVVARFTDTSNYLYVRAVPGFAAVELHQVVGGTDTNLKGYFAGEGKRLTLEVWGSSARVFIDGVPLGPAVAFNAGLTGQRYGLFSNNDTTVRFDNFEVDQWRNLSAAGHGARSTSLRHGKSKRTDPVDPNEVTVVANNRNGNLDPENPNGLYTPNVKRGTQMRARWDTRPDTTLPINLLTLDQALHMGARNSWGANANATAPAYGVSVTFPGSDFIASTTAAALGDMSVLSPVTIPVGPGKVSVQTMGLGAVGRSRFFIAEWQNAAGTVLSTVNSPDITGEETQRWTRAAHTFTAPANTAKMRLGIGWRAVPAGEKHWWVGVSAAAGDIAPWTIPGGIYPLVRGYLMDVVAGYSHAGADADAWATLVINDITAQFAQHKLWPAVLEHDTLDGHVGRLPVAYYPMDSQDMKDLVNQRTGSVTNNPGQTQAVIQSDSRPLMSFGQGKGQEAQTAFVPAVSISATGDWRIDFAFYAIDNGLDQMILTTTDLGFELDMRAADRRITFRVFRSDGTLLTGITTGAGIVYGERIHFCTITHRGADNAAGFFMDGVLVGSTIPVAGLTPKAFGSDIILGADRGGGRGFVGGIGRLAFFDHVASLANHQTANGAFADPWGFNNDCGSRLAFLFEQFRHKKDNAGASVAGTLPGIPASWYNLDNPSEVTPQMMVPEGRYMLDYLRALERTEFGYLVVHHDGVIRFRQRIFQRNPGSPDVTLNGKAASGEIPYMRAEIGRSPDIITSVGYERTSRANSAGTVESADVGTFGTLHHSLDDLESDSEALARQAANDVLAINSTNPPHPIARVTLRPAKPSVGWHVLLFEPGHEAFLRAVLPQYTHSKRYQVLHVSHDCGPAADEWETTLELIGY